MSSSKRPKPKPLDFSLKGAAKHTGSHTYVEVRRGKDFVNLARISPEEHSEFMLALVWRTDQTFVDIRGRYTNSKGAECDFQTKPEFARNLFTDADHRKVLFAPLNHDTEVLLEITLDTDDGAFLSKNPDNNPGGIVEELRVFAYPKTQTKGDTKKLRLNILPVTPMKPFGGVVALDLGNTSSTLVCLETDNAEVIDVEQGRLAHQARATPSALRILEYDNTPAGVQTSVLENEGTLYFAAYECKIGRAALESSDAGWLVLGAKRLLSDEPQNHEDVEHPGELEIYLHGETVLLPRSEPAEIFVANMFRSFYNQKIHYPQPLVVTCPVTFSKSEARELCTAIYQAWRRSRGLNNSHFPAKATNELVAQVIDEASAAGFYFLYEDFITAPGRLPGFRYLYPNGMHLLLYDCGGGTTDISLIKAIATDQQHLKIEILGRAGHRNFGGDTITTAVFRILKAKVAELIGGPSFPSACDAIKQDLEEKVLDIDEFVPTRFFSDDPTHPVNPNDEDVRRRMQRALLLWKWAENIKHGLSDGSTADTEHKRIPTLNFEEYTRLGSLLNIPDDHPGWKRVGPGGVDQPFTFTLEEVNCLVNGGILETIRYANDLLQARLPRDGDVEAIYVVGNASRYPRIKELLKDPQNGLQVRFLDQRMADVDPSVLKNSVALGALRALQLTEGHYGIDVKFDKQFMDRLPYSVTCKNLGGISDTVLFKEHKLYDQLGVEEIQIPEEATTRKLTLYRLWPGDSHPEAFLEFEFSEPVSGQLYVSYNRELMQFVIQVGETVVVGKPIYDRFIQCAPVQTGLL